MRDSNAPQVNKQHYSFGDYSSERRYLSYFHQIKIIMQLVEQKNASKILIAGKGDGVVQKILEAYNELYDLNLVIRTFDFAEDLHPDILGDLLDIGKLVSEQYDIILCCQVLEHLPFDESVQVLSQMHGISKYVIMSVPYKAITRRGTLKVPLINEFEFCLKVPIWHNKKGMVNSYHYWELGYSISVKNFKNILQKIGYHIMSAYLLKKDGYKYFILLESGR
jgi:hypothetical protein